VFLVLGFFLLLALTYVPALAL